jgi:hypothetical protein
MTRRYFVDTLRSLSRGLCITELGKTLDAGESL